VKRIAAIVGVSLLSLAAFTFWALESGGVATITTTRDDGTSRSTHVWYAADDGDLWLEAGTPENGWFLDVQRVPEVVVVIDGLPAHYVVEPDRSATARERIRSLLREKYGVRDRWVALLFDTSRSVAVRLRRSRQASG
jgi:hypothetical protein